MDRLLPQSSLLLVVDVQERLLAAMPEEAAARLTKNTRVLLDTAALLQIPIVVSEQYPKGLGATVGAVSERLIELGVTPIAKLDFDAASEPAIARAIAGSAARSVVVVGMEAHICVFQTARELVRRGYATYAVGDACASRTEENRAAGLRLCEHAGAFVSTTETVVFDWVGRAGNDAFRAVSKWVR